MPQDTFVFKQFTIHQDKCAMKVGTDAVLLGSWVDTNQTENILDVGTGTGILALMMAQRSSAFIDAVEMNKESCEQAKQNASFSKWDSRIEIHCVMFQEYAANCQKKYQLIISNPPYFTGSLKAKEDSRTQARHNDNLPFQELIEGVLKLLHKSGKFCLILPCKEAIEVRTIAEKRGLYLSKLLRIKSKEGKENEIRHIMQFEFQPKGFSESTLYIEKNAPGIDAKNYTDSYKELTKDFYLNFKS